MGSHNKSERFSSMNLKNYFLKPQSPKYEHNSKNMFLNWCNSIPTNISFILQFAERYLGRTLSFACPVLPYFVSNW